MYLTGTEIKHLLAFHVTPKHFHDLATDLIKQYPTNIHLFNVLGGCFFGVWEAPISDLILHKLQS